MPISRFFTCIHSQCPADRFLANVPWQFSAPGNPNTTGPSNNQTLWVFKTNGDVWSSPAVADGIVYVGSFDRYLYAVNATDGSKVWSFKTGGTIFTSPAVANNVVYIGSRRPQHLCFRRPKRQLNLELHNWRRPLNVLPRLQAA